MSTSEISEDGEVEVHPRLNIKQFPTILQGRVKALKNLQLETIKAETEYYNEVHRLDVKYQAKYDEVNQKRAKVVSGVHEPSGVEVEWPSEDEDEEEEEDHCPIREANKGPHPDFPADSKGIPKFWLHTLKSANEEALLGVIEPHDEPLIAHLTDLTVSLHADNTGFTLNFCFEENPFFANQVLTKEYILRDGPDPESPLEYDGPEIVSCKGCKIDWKEGMDLTNRTIVVEIETKKEEGGSMVKTTKEIKADSFFTFFSPPTINEDGECEDDDDKATLAVDFDVGFALKEKIIPRAVLYFTGDILEDEDECFEDCEGDDDEEDDEEESEGE